MVLNMRRWWCFVVLAAAALALAGCDSPSPAFSRIEAKRIAVDGSVFSVRHTDYDAEAIRISKEWHTTRGGTVLKGAKAIMLASGCPVKAKSLSGDTNIVRARLNCEGVPARPARPVTPEVLCEVEGQEHLRDGDTSLAWCEVLRPSGG